MRISRIYYPLELQVGTSITLSTTTSHYLLHVLRLKINENLLLFNGTGNEYPVHITNIGKKEVTLQIDSCHSRDTESPLKIHLAQAISRIEKMDWIIQKAVELGATRITPLLTDFCQIKLDPTRASNRQTHWEKVIISACEQSGRTFIPTLSPIISFKQWITQVDTRFKLFCDPEASQTINSLKLSGEVLMLIGPEGGLSPEEISSLVKNNFTGITLGPRILRTETAALSAMTIAQSCWGDLREKHPGV